MNKKLYILKPQKCKIRKELANEIKQTLNLYTTLEDLDLNTDSIKIGDIEIKTKDQTKQYTKNNYDYKILAKNLKNKSHETWNERW